MKADLKKLELAMAQACMSTSELAEASAIPKTTLNRVFCGKNSKPATIGKVARALDVDVTAIIKTEE